MTTAEHLERVNDTGLFEILGMRALRHLFPDCKCLEHAGVNAQGKTIPGSIDSFTRVPGSSPSKYVAAAFTTASREELKRKWYSEGRSDPLSAQPKRLQKGDLVKACETADAIRKDEADSEFRIYLCTNQRLDPSLMLDGYALGAQHAVDVVFVAQSMLRDLLDGASGQLLREEFFGKRATSVSRELIQHLGRLGLANYQIEGFANDSFVPTAAWRQALGAMESTIPLLALVGRPGSGKSVIARSLLERRLENGGIGLWIPGDFLQEARSLNDAITLTLRQLDPYLGDEAGHSTSALASQEHPLLLVFDDPNRTDGPGAVVRKIVGWGRNLVAEANKGRGWITLVMPVWESQFSNLQGNFDGAKWLRQQNIGPMERGESITCLRNGLGCERPELSHSQLAQIADRLNDDPILLSTFARLARADARIEVAPILDDVIGRFVDRSLRDLASAKNVLKTNYELALAELTRQMLVRRTLHPEWRQLTEWLQSDALQSLEQIALRGDVCRITNQGRRDVFEFRHDRILEHQLSKAVAVEFRLDQPDWAAIFDPYMLQMTARAIAVEDAEESILDLALARLPVALIAALPLLRPGSPLSNQICQRASTWLRSIHHEPQSVQWDALSMLQNTRSDYILAVTKDMFPTQSMLFARLRNGDAAAGASALGVRFYPRANFSWLESLIIQTASLDGDKLVAQIADILTAPPRTNDARCGALTLAGYLSNQSLGDAILVAWQSATDVDEIILPALWAALRCSDPAGSLPSAILPAIFSVSDEPGGGGMSARKAMFQELASAARHGLSADVLIFLRDLAERDDRYEDLVFSLFGHVDHRVSLEFIVTRMAKWAARPVEPGHISGVFMWESQWRMTSGFEYEPMPPDCVEALQEWYQPGNPDWLRRYAFRLWVRFSGDPFFSTELPADLEASDDIVWERAKRGDPRVVGHVLRKMNSESHWFQVIRYMWSDSFEPALDVALKAGDWFAVQALRDAPNETAERLIAANWNTIRDKPNGIAAGLYVARNSTVALASSAVMSDSDATDKLCHAGNYFGFREHGYSEKITARHLEVVRPFLNLFDIHSLTDIAEFCGRNGYHEWAHENLISVCRQRLADSDHNVPAANVLAGSVRRLFPTDEELMTELDQIASGDEHRVKFAGEFWADGFNERSDGLGRMEHVLNQWLDSDPAVSRFRLAALAIRHQGSRRSLEILKRFSTNAGWPSMEGFYRDAEYAVMRRSLA